MNQTSRSFDASSWTNIPSFVPCFQPRSPRPFHRCKESSRLQLDISADGRRCYCATKPSSPPDNAPDKWEGPVHLNPGHNLWRPLLTSFLELEGDKDCIRGQFRKPVVENEFEIVTMLNRHRYFIQMLLAPATHLGEGDLAFQSH